MAGGPVSRQRALQIASTILSILVKVSPEMEGLVPTSNSELMAGIETGFGQTLSIDAGDLETKFSQAVRYMSTIGLIPREKILQIVLRMVYLLDPTVSENHPPFRVSAKVDLTAKEVIKIMTGQDLN